MAQLVKAAQAGFDEKNDALVTVEPIASGIEIELTSKVMRQYGDQIKSVILNTVKEAGYDGVKVIVQDKNAWDYTIKARVLGALERGEQSIMANDKTFPEVKTNPLTEAAKNACLVP